jgi:hypothetical protein
VPTKGIFYFDNTFAGAVAQRDVGPLHPGTVNRAFRAACRGELSFQSFNPAVPFTTEDDLVWGLQWVNHGAAPVSVITSLYDDHWFWRHALTLTSDVTRGWGPQSTTGTIQGSDPLDDEWRGQSVKPGVDIDLYVSIQASFGIVGGTFTMLGTVELVWE